MPTLSQGASADLSVYADSTLTIQNPGGYCRVENPIGTIVHEGGAASWPVDVRSGSVRITAVTGSVFYELTSDPAVASEDGALSSAAPAQLFAPPFFGGEYSVVAPGTSTISMSTGPNGRPALKCVVPAGTNCEVAFTALNGAHFGGEAYISYHGTRVDGVEVVSMYVTPDANYSTRFLLATYTSFLAHPGNASEQGGAMTARFGSDNWTQGTGTPAPSSFTIGTHKVRVTATASADATVYIYGVGVATPRRKARLAVVVDDGYDSWFALGQPVCDEYRVRVTSAIIPVMVDSESAAARMHQLRRLVHAGGAVVAHGPNVGVGNGNLFTEFATTAARIADMTAARDWIATNGLATPGYRACYVWPQGMFMPSFGDTALLAAALANGFYLGRGAGVVGTGLIPNVDALSAYQRLAVPVIGHLWAGSTAAEATNIANIVARIAAAGSAKTDAMLMLHRVQASSTPDGSMSSIGIRVSDLTTIVAAIKTEVDAGRMESVTMPEMATTRGGNPWAIV